MKHKSIYIETVVAAMCEHVPAKTPAKKAKYKAIATEWLDKVAKSCVFNYYTRNEKTYLSTYRIKLNFSHRYRKDGKMSYWYHWFLENNPLWILVNKGYKGNSSQASEVRLLNAYNGKLSTAEYRIELLKEIGGSGYYEENLAKINKQLTEKQGRAIVQQQIDFDNLRIYIKETERSIAHDNLDKAKKDTMLRNLEAAWKIVVCMDLDSQTLPVLTTDHNFGRTFHGGVNLQGVHSEVRKAALGECYNYDVEASVFGYYMKELARIETTQPKVKNCLTMLGFMLDNKTAFREDLATECLEHLSISKDEKVAIVKRALTALGFGAKKDNFYFNHDIGEYRDALPNIITNKEARDNFLNHDAVKLVLKAIEVLIDDVRTQYKTDSAFQAEIDAVPEIRSKKRINFKQVLAYKYQQYEKTIRAAIIDCFDSEVLLQTHDGIYTKQDLDICAINDQLELINPAAKVDCDVIRGYIYKPAHNKLKTGRK